MRDDDLGRKNVDRADERMKQQPVMAGKLEKQEKLSLLEDPAFTIADVEKEMAKMNKLAKKIFGKKAPKAPKKPKKEEKDEEEKSDAGDDSSKTEDDGSSKTEEKEQSEHVEDL